MARVLVVPASMYQIYPTLVTPGASSSMRSFSPSKLTMGRSPAAVSVRRTTNSWVLVPELVTAKVTFPATAAAEDRWMNIWVGEVSPSAAVTVFVPPGGGGVVAAGRAASVLQPPGPPEVVLWLHAGRTSARPASATSPLRAARSSLPGARRCGTSRVDRRRGKTCTGKL